MSQYILGKDLCQFGSENFTIYVGLLSRIGFRNVVKHLTMIERTQHILSRYFQGDDWLLL